MLTTFRQSYKTLIQTSADSMPVGMLIDMVVNPDKGEFAAFWVKALDGQKLLLPKDIVSWDQNHIIINDNNDLSDAESLPRLAKIFAKECRILKAPVFDQAQQKILGTVRDFTFDTISPRLLALEVEKNWLGWGRHRIPQHRIVAIKSNRIIVDSSLLKTETKPAAIKKKVAAVEVPELGRPSRKDK